MRSITWHFSATENMVNFLVIRMILGRFHGVAWRVLVKTRIEDGSFGIDYPKNCPDDRGPYGTDEISFEDALFAVVRGLPMKGFGKTFVGDGPPKTIDILDLLEFAGCMSGIRPIDLTTAISNMTICRSIGNWANSNSRKRSIKFSDATGWRIS